MSRCTWTGSRLGALRDGFLTGGECRRVAEHVATCATCAGELHLLEAQERDLMLARPVPAPPDEAVYRTIFQVALRSSAAARSRQICWGRVVGTAAAGFSVAAAVFVGASGLVGELQTAWVAETTLLPEPPRIAATRRTTPEAALPFSRERPASIQAEMSAAAYSRHVLLLVSGGSQSNVSFAGALAPRPDLTAAPPSGEAQDAFRRLRSRHRRSPVRLLGTAVRRTGAALRPTRLARVFSGPADGALRAVVAEMPADAPGYARTSASHAEPDGTVTWTRTTIGTDHQVELHMISRGRAATPDRTQD